MRLRIDPVLKHIANRYSDKVVKTVREATKARINRDTLGLITRISDDMRDRIGELLRDGEDKGRSVAATASKLLTTGLDKGIFRSARRRAYLIARTELHRARQRAAVDLYRAAHIDLVKWVGIGDGRICAHCKALDGRIFHLEEIEDRLPPLHPRCRCRLLPANFQLRIEPRRGDVIRRTIVPIPDDYRYIIRVGKIGKALPSAGPASVAWEGFEGYKVKDDKATTDAKRKAKKEPNVAYGGELYNAGQGMEKGHKDDYSCVMAELDSITSRDIKGLLAKINSEDIHKKTEEEDEPHITIRYGLHTEIPNEVRSVLRGTQMPLKAAILGVDIFEPGERDYDVLVLKANSPDIELLNDKLGKLENTTEFKFYQPHITIAYLKRGTGKNYRTMTTGLEGKEIEINVLEFSDKDHHLTEIVKAATIRVHDGSTEKLTPRLSKAETEVKQYQRKTKRGISTVKRHQRGYVPASWHPGNAMNQRALILARKAIEDNLDRDDPGVKLAYEVANVVQKVGGRALFVGGAVRDAILGKKAKDIDVEVYNVNKYDLEAILKKMGKVDAVGRSFGVFKLSTPDIPALDVSIPRRESKIGAGHKGFMVESDPTMTVREAASRRDLTINCFSGDTEIITIQGVYPIKQLLGSQKLLTQDGEWVEGIVKSGGYQRLMKLTISRNGIDKVIYATSNHRWFIKNHHTQKYDSIRTTDHLIKGHRLPSVFPRSVSKTPSVEGICRGFVFGDGSLSYSHYPKVWASHANFCGEKDKFLLPFFDNLGKGGILRTYTKFSRITGLPKDWKQYPDLDSDISFLYGWLAGYFAADGCVDKKGCPTLSSSDREHLEFVKKVCYKLGIGVFSITTVKGAGFNSNYIGYILSFVRSTLSPDFFIIPQHRQRFEKICKRERTGWTVKSVEFTDRIEEVYCAEVLITHSFVLEGNILTSNSMAYDPIKNELIDEFEGVQDLKNGILRATNPQTFVEDPLRVLRVMGFAGRFGFKPDEDLVALCNTLNLKELPRERVYEELSKLLLKSDKPGIGLRLIPALGIGELFPELIELVGLPQEPDWHPEGDAWEHTMRVVDAAATMRDTLPDPKDRMIFMLGALFHDVGKPKTTLMRDGKLTTYDHDEVGADMMEGILGRLTAEKDVIEKVESLVRHHMKPTFLMHAQKMNKDWANPKVRDSAIRRLAKKVDIPMIVMISSVDKMGRGNENIDLTAEKWLLERHYELGLDKPKALDPIVMGRHLIPLGVEPGRRMGEILDKIYEAQLDGKFKTPEKGIEYAKEQGWIQKAVSEVKEEIIEKAFNKIVKSAPPKLVVNRRELLHFIRKLKKAKEKLVPRREDEKIVWAKRTEKGYIMKNVKFEKGDTILLKSGEIAKITAVGKDGLTARDDKGNKYEVFYKNAKKFVPRRDKNE